MILFLLKIRSVNSKCAIIELPSNPYKIIRSNDNYISIGKKDARLTTTLTCLFVVNVAVMVMELISVITELIALSVQEIIQFMIAPRTS